MCSEQKLRGEGGDLGCQVLQQHKDLAGALNTLSIADSLSITVSPSHYTVLLSLAAEMKNLAATKQIHQHLSNDLVAHINISVTGALVNSYASCGELGTGVSVFEDGI